MTRKEIIHNSIFESSKNRKSVDNKINEIKLEIYESVDSGSITRDEADSLFSMLESSRADANKAINDTLKSILAQNKARTISLADLNKMAPDDPNDEETKSKFNELKQRILNLGNEYSKAINELKNMKLKLK